MFSNQIHSTTTFAFPDPNICPLCGFLAHPRCTSRALELTFCCQLVSTQFNPTNGSSTSVWVSAPASTTATKKEAKRNILSKCKSYQTSTPVPCVAWAIAAPRLRTRSLARSDEATHGAWFTFDGTVCTACLPQCHLALFFCHSVHLEAVLPGLPVLLLNGSVLLFV